MAIDPDMAGPSLASVVGRNELPRLVGSSPKISHWLPSNALVRRETLERVHADWKETGARIDSDHARLEIVEQGGVQLSGLLGGAPRDAMPSHFTFTPVGGNPEQLAVPDGFAQQLGNQQFNAVAAALRSANAARSQVGSAGQDLSFRMRAPLSSSAKYWDVAVRVAEGDPRRVLSCEIRNPHLNRRVARGEAPPEAAGSTHTVRTPVRVHQGTLNRYQIVPDDGLWYAPERLAPVVFPQSLATAITATLQRQEGVAQPMLYMGRNTDDERGRLLCRVNDAEGNHATVFFEQAADDDSLVVASIRYRSAAQSGVQTTVNIPNPAAPLEPRRLEHDADSSAPSVASDLTVSDVLSQGSRKRLHEPGDSASERSLRMRMADVGVEDADFTVTQTEPFLLCAQPPGLGGCLAAVINHLFQERLLRPSDIATGTLDATARRVEALSGNTVAMQYRGYPLPTDEVGYRQDLAQAANALQGILHVVGDAVFEVGNLSSSTTELETHQVTLKLIADRDGQFGPNDQSYWWVLDSRDPQATDRDRPAAAATRFNDLEQALDHIARQTTQQSQQSDTGAGDDEGMQVLRMLSCYVPSTALPPSDPQATQGGTLPYIGYVQRGKLQSEELRQLQFRGTIVRPTPADSTSTTEATQVATSQPSTVGTAESPAISIPGIEKLTDPGDRIALQDYVRALPRTADQVDTALHFLVALETLETNLAAYMAIESLQKRGEIAAEFLAGYQNQRERARVRTELATFLLPAYRQHHPQALLQPPALNDPTQPPPGWADLIPTLALVTDDAHRTILQEYCVAQAIVGVMRLSTTMNTAALILRRLTEAGRSLPDLLPLVATQREEFERLVLNDKKVCPIANNRNALISVVEVHTGVMYSPYSSQAQRKPMDERTDRDADRAAQWGQQALEGWEAGTHSPYLSHALVELASIVGAGEGGPALRDQVLMPQDEWQGVLSSGTFLAHDRDSLQAFRAWAHIETFLSAADHGGDSDRIRERMDSWMRIAGAGWSLHASRWDLIKDCRSSTPQAWREQVDRDLEGLYPNSMDPERAATVEVLVRFRSFLDSMVTPPSPGS